MFRFLDFWVFGFLDLLCFALVFPICRNSSQIGFGKTAFVSVFTVFFGGVRAVGGTIYMYIHIYIYIYI